MRTNCRNQVLNLIKQIKNLQVNCKCPEAMLILDEVTAPLLSAVVNQFLALGVKNVTKANLIKQPFPHYVGIYYISKASLHYVFDDFKKQPIYHSINILLNEPITSELMQTVADNKKVTQRLSYFGQLLLNTKYLTNTLGIVCSQRNLFAESLLGQIKTAASTVADSILQALISGFSNLSKLLFYHSSNPYIQEVVKELMSKYAAFRENSLPQFDQKDDKSLRVIIVDRKIDIVSPLVSNFYYLNMISDIFEVDFNKKEAVLKNDTKIIINFQNQIFQDYKNLHISKAQNKIEPDFQKFQSESKAAQLKQQSGPIEGNRLSNLDLKLIIRDIPEYNKKIKSYEELINLFYQITEISKTQKLPDIGEIEQMIVSGIDGRGEEIKDKKIVQRALELCSRLTNPYKIVKITLLMILCLELSQSQRKMFINKIKEYQRYSDLAKILEHKLKNILQKPVKLKLSPQKERQFLHLHESLIESILIELIEKGVSKHVNLTVAGDQTKKTESKFQMASKKKEKEWVIVMIGGISLNEIVHLQRLQMRYEGIKISIITTEVLAAWSYIDRLSNEFKN